METFGADGGSADDGLPGRAGSPWHDRPDRSARAPVDRETSVDVAVVGGGIIGLTAALELARSGARVAVLERRRVGAGVTGSTTAKLTSLHGLRYASLRSTRGEAAARAYAEINEAGIATVVGLVAELGISCDLRRKPHLAYTEDPAGRGAIEEEVEAATAAGLAVDYVEEAGLPFPIAAAARIGDQAELDPIAYLEGLVSAIEDAGSSVYEDAAAVGVTGGDVLVAGGHRVRAGRVVVATQLPFLDRGLLFARAKPSRSYALTARVATPPLGEMYISTSSPTRSLRSMGWRDEELLIVAGQGHAMGHGDADESLRALVRFARERFGATGIEHRWSAHDYVSEDGLPYIGRLTPRSDRVVTATGMGKWGLAMGTTAGRMMSDSLLGRPSRWAEIFDPWRLPPLRGTVPLIEHNVDAGLAFVGDRLRRGASAEGIAPGEGRVVGAGRGRRAVYRDDAGPLHWLSARCTHLGCLVRWNGPERTWDCPCHGSRFGARGEVLSGPAVHPLEHRDPPG